MWVTTFLGFLETGEVMLEESDKQTLRNYHAGSSARGAYKAELEAP